GRHAILRAERERVRRRMRLLTALEIGEQREPLDLRIEKPDGCREVEALVRAPVERALEPRKHRALRVRGHEYERRRIAELELQWDLDLLVVAARVEHTDVRAQAPVGRCEPIAALRAREVL